MEIRYVGAAHMHTAQLDRRMDGLTNLTGAFHDYANASQNKQKYITACLPYTPGSTKRLGENTTNLEQNSSLIAMAGCQYYYHHHHSRRPRHSALTPSFRCTWKDNI